MSTFRKIHKKTPFLLVKKLFAVDQKYNNNKILESWHFHIWLIFRFSRESPPKVGRLKNSENNQWTPGTMGHLWCDVPRATKKIIWFCRTQMLMVVFTICQQSRPLPPTTDDIPEQEPIGPDETSLMMPHSWAWWCPHATPTTKPWQDRPGAPHTRVKVRTSGGPGKDLCESNLPWKLSIH